jgi:hypothetical protein
MYNGVPYLLWIKVPTYIKMKLSVKKEITGIKQEIGTST